MYMYTHSGNIIISNIFLSAIEMSITNFICVFLFFFGIFSDAEDAVKARDGYDYDGYRLRVEFPRGGGGPGNFRSSRNSDRGRSNRGAQFFLTFLSHFFGFYFMPLFIYF